MRVAGHTYADIAKELDVTQKMVLDYIRHKLSDCEEHEKFLKCGLRRISNRRIESAVHKVLRIINDPDSDDDIVLKAADKLVKLEERICRSLGLDETERLEVTSSDITPDRVRELAAARFGQVTPDQLTEV
jgi:predicted transcriptional regulator